MNKNDQKLEKGRWCDELKAFYDRKKRNATLNEEVPASTGGKKSPMYRREQTQSKRIIYQIVKKATEGVAGILSDQDTDELVKSIKAFDAKNSVSLLARAEKKADKDGKLSSLTNIRDARSRLLSFLYEVERPGLNH